MKNLYQLASQKYLAWMRALEKARTENRLLHESFYLDYAMAISSIYALPHAPRWAEIERRVKTLDFPK